MDSKATVGWPIPPTAPSAGCPDVVQPATVRPPAVIASATRAALSTAKHPAAPPRYVPRNIANPCPATAPIMACRNVPHCRRDTEKMPRGPGDLRMDGSASPAAGPIGARSRTHSPLRACHQGVYATLRRAMEWSESARSSRRFRVRAKFAQGSGPAGRNVPPPAVPLFVLNRDCGTRCRRCVGRWGWR